MAVTGETGRYPFMFEIILSMLKYYRRLLSSKDVLLTNANKESSVAHEQGKTSWIGCI